MQEQTGSLTGERHLASDTSDRHLRRLWDPAAGGVSAAAASGTMHSVLQVSCLQWRGEAGPRRGAAGGGRHVRVAAVEGQRYAPVFSASDVVRAEETVHG